MPIILVPSDIASLKRISLRAVTGTGANASAGTIEIISGIAIVPFIGNRNTDWTRDEVIYSAGPAGLSPAHSQASAIAFPATFDNTSANPGLSVGWGIDLADCYLSAAGQYELHARIVVKSTASEILRMGFQLILIY
jgi:hypothetical protein